MNDIFLYPCKVCKSKQQYLICKTCIYKYFKKSDIKNKSNTSNTLNTTNT